MKLYLYKEGGDRLPDGSWRERLFLNCAVDYVGYIRDANVVRAVSSPNAFVSDNKKFEDNSNTLCAEDVHIDFEIINREYVMKDESMDFHIDRDAREIESNRANFEIHNGLQSSENTVIDFALKYGAHGKPYFAKPPLAGEVFFSISHSGRYWAALFADSEVGFDIEDVSPRIGMSAERMEKIAKRFFTEDERRYVFGRMNSNCEQSHEAEGADADLTYSHVGGCAGASYEHDHIDLNSSMSRDDILRRFFRIWTAKEAYIKYTGNGLSEGLQSFSAIAPPLGVVITTYAPYPDIIYSYCRASAAMGDSNFIAMELTDSSTMQDVTIRTVSNMD